MAAVHGPIPASHHSPFRSTHNASHPRVAYQPPAPSVKPPSTQPTSSRQDPFHGHEQNSKLCARFITHLFACPEYPPSSSNSTVKLPHFIAYALHRTKLHVSVTFAALVLLQRLKARFPTARGSSGHRLFISAFMLASNVICEDTYSNKSWSIVAQGMFQLREINQMEREMCQYLEWELNVDPVTLREFEEMIRKDFVGPGPYPTYILPSTKKSTPPPTATSSHSGVRHIAMAAISGRQDSKMDKSSALVTLNTQASSLLHNCHLPAPLPQLSMSRPTIHPPPSLPRPASFSLYVPSQSCPVPTSRPSTSRSATIPPRVSSRPLPPCPVSLASPSTSRLSHSFPSRQPLPPSSIPLASLSAPGVPEGTTSVTSRFQLPAPVTTNDDTSPLKGRINVERSAVPPLIALTAGLAAVSSSQPRAVLLFIGAATVILGIYFVVPPKDGEKTYMSAFLHRLPDVFTAAGCTLIVLGIGTAFPDEVALIPLFSFISFAALALLSGAILAVWVTAALYGAALCSLVTFVVLAFMA